VILLGALALALQGNGERGTPDAPGTLATSSTAPRTAGPPPGALPGAVVLEQTVRNYYGLLPQNTTAAWEFLGEPARAKSRGFAEYVAFWNGINAVSIRGPVTVQGNTVLANLQFDPKDRGRTLERYQLTMSPAADGRVLIQSSTLLSSSAADSGNRGRGGGAEQRGGDGNGGG
jgi:hypothetical protein